MIDCGKPPSNQSELRLGDSDEAEWAKAREWVEDHPDDFEWYLAFAREHHGASPNFMIQMMRAVRNVSVRNGHAAALARMAMERDPELSFNLAKSRFDGFTEAVL